MTDETKAPEQGENQPTPAGVIAAGTMPEPDLTNARPSLPRFRSHKVVSAGKIVAMSNREVGGAELQLAMPGPDGRPATISVLVGPEYCAKHNPCVGGYFVVYEDGYQSWSPAEAFEQGYRPVELQWPVVQASSQAKRIIREHVVNEANGALLIEVLDDPGSGGASHLYRIAGFDTASNPSDPFVARHGEPARYSTILFQNGSIAEAGVNGITHEALLAIVADRLQCFQMGRHACKENALALRYLNEARQWLETRTRRRQQAGTEGTHQGA